MTEAEMLKMIRQIAGIRPPAGKQEATQPDSVIAENYARVVAEVMRRDGIELNAYSALFDHGLASKSDQRFASIRSPGNLTFSTAF